MSTAKFAQTRAKKKAAAENRTGIETIGITRRDGETWRECVARYGEEAGEGYTEEMLAAFDRELEATWPEWAALRACWDYLACDHEQGA